MNKELGAKRKTNIKDVTAAAFVLLKKNHQTGNFANKYVLFFTHSNNYTLVLNILQRDTERYKILFFKVGWRSCS